VLQIVNLIGNNMRALLELYAQFYEL